MKTKLIAVMLLVASGLCAQNKLTIVVDGIENPKGQLMVGVYGKNNFMKSNPLYGQVIKIESETVTIELEDVKSGEYAVSLYQDENNNQKLDMGTFGPTEKYGFSNNARGEMGAPKFDDCKFVVESDITIYITL